MFDFSTWVVNSLIAGVKNGTFPREWAAVWLGSYYANRKLSADDVTRFETETQKPEIITETAE